MDEQELRFYFRKLDEFKKDYPSIYRHFIALMKAMVKEMEEG